MINSCKDTKSINKFQYVAIPSPRDIFNKYGERINANPVFTSDASGSGDCVCMAKSTIEQMYSAQSSLEKECSNRK